VSDMCVQVPALDCITRVVEPKRRDWKNEDQARTCVSTSCGPLPPHRLPSPLYTLINPLTEKFGRAVPLISPGIETKFPKRSSSSFSSRGRFLYPHSSLTTPTPTRTRHHHPHRTLSHDWTVRFYHLTVPPFTPSPPRPHLFSFSNEASVLPSLTLSASPLFSPLPHPSA